MPPGGIPQVARSRPSGACDTSEPASGPRTRFGARRRLVRQAKRLLGHDGLALGSLVSPWEPACAAALSAPCPRRLRRGTRLQRCGQPLDSAAKPGKRKVESPQPGKQAQMTRPARSDQRPHRSRTPWWHGWTGWAARSSRSPSSCAGAAGTRSDQLRAAGRPGRACRVLRARNRMHSGVLPDRRTWRSLFENTTTSATGWLQVVCISTEAGMGSAGIVEGRTSRQAGP